MSFDTAERKTLQGLGPFLQNDECPACRLKNHQTPDADIAFTYGIAVVYFRGAEATNASLCAKHRGMVYALVHEAKHPSGSDF